MKKSKKITSVLTTIALVGASIWMSISPVQVFAAQMQNHQVHQMNQSSQNNEAALKAAHTDHIPALSLSIEKAILAVKAGDDAIALSELQKAQTLLEAVKQAVLQQIQPEFVNTKCPMMGGTINPEKVTDALTRQFNGQTIAFCCNACPGMWDRLTDEQKQAKLVKVMANSQ